MKAYVYYIHSFTIDNYDDFRKGEEWDLDKIKASEHASKMELSDFVHDLNNDQVDSQGLFAYSFE